jgi:hypothetical protein
VQDFYLLHVVCIQWVPGALFPEIKLPEREADHLPPTSPEVYAITPP